jgi:molybdopterin-guanine dinucleotide biosynthesis protein A
MLRMGAAAGTDGRESASTGMTINSIKQNCEKTFPILWLSNAGNFNVNILDKLSICKPDRAAWVLVGGRSSRMGVNKAKAESGGRALALRVADQAALSVGGNVSLVGDPSVYGDLGLPVIPDAFPGEGPLAGIEAALAATNIESNLIVACDMPNIHESLLEELFLAGGDCALPLHADGRMEPLCAVYLRTCHPVIRAALSAGVRKVTDALAMLATHGCAIRYVRVSDPAAFANLNTPEDWRRYHHG